MIFFQGSWTGEAAVTVAVATAGILYQQYRLHEKTKHDREKEQTAIAKAIEDRDSRLGWVLEEFSLHKHGEKGDNEPLTTDGIHYPKTKV